LPKNFVPGLLFRPGRIDDLEEKVHLIRICCRTLWIPVIYNCICSEENWTLWILAGFSRSRWVSDSDSRVQDRFL